ncbi:MAG: fused MFS/spermidine synthase, partial [Acidobacteriota bacterium]
MPLNLLAWYVLIFSVGVASTAVEITGLRFLAPLFGSSLPVWGSAIATVLAGLAWGYSEGGRQAQTRTPLPLVFRYSVVGSVVFLWIPVAFRLVTYAQNVYLTSNNSVALISAFGLSFLTLFVPSFIFGMINPLAVQAQATAREQAPGEVAGKIASLSTIGSLVGILLPSFLLIPLVGTNITVWLCAAPALLLGLRGFFKQRRDTRLLVLLAVTLSTVFLPNRHESNVLFAAETRQQHVTVREHNGSRLLTFDASLGIQSLFTKNTYTHGYWDYLAAVPAFFASQDHLSVLVLGAAASTTERQMHRLWQEAKTFDFTSVEIDSELFAIADRYFYPPARQTVVADARRFVAADNHQYDLIIIDVYERELSVPFHLTTVEFFEQLRPRLAPGGIVAININATDEQTLWVRSLARTAAAIFPEVRLAAVPDSCNFLLLATTKSWPQATSALPLIQPLLPPLENATRPDADGLLLT